MRCVCCNKMLNDVESTRKHADTGEYLDMCNKCLSFVPEIPYVERTDLMDDHDVEEEEDYGEGDPEDDMP